MPKKTDDFEKQIKRIEEIVARLEEGDLPLEKGVSLYKEGLGLVKSCRQTLAKAKNEVTTYSEGLLKELDIDQEAGDE